MTFRVMRHKRRKEGGDRYFSSSGRQRARARAYMWSGFLMALLVMIVGRARSPEIPLGRLMLVFGCFLAACMLVVAVGKRLR